MITTFLMASALAQSPEIQVDLHLDTPTQMFTKGLRLDSAHGLEASKSRLKAGGTNVAVQVIWPARKTDYQKRSFDLLRLMEREIQRDDELVLLREPAEIARVVADQKLGIILSMEGAHGLGQTGDWMSIFDQFYERGLRLLGITWSFSNRFAGSSGDNGGGLTEEGRDLVKRAREKGVILDVSHASRASTLEICRDSPHPVIASHSNAHKLRSHSRNLTDEEILCIAKTGGVIGLNFHAPFVGQSKHGVTDVVRVADHADYLARIGGHGVVALGSDFDGYIRKPTGLEDASKVPELWSELRRRGWSEDQISGVRGLNFLRAWSAARPSP